jgi:hypothetical protein
MSSEVKKIEFGGVLTVEYVQEGDTIHVKSMRPQGVLDSFLSLLTGANVIYDDKADKASGGQLLEPSDLNRFAGAPAGAPNLGQTPHVHPQPVLPGMIPDQPIHREPSTFFVDTATAMETAMESDPSPPFGASQAVTQPPTVAASQNPTLPQVQVPMEQPMTLKPPATAGATQASLSPSEQQMLQQFNVANPDAGQYAQTSQTSQGDALSAGPQAAQAQAAQAQAAQAQAAQAQQPAENSIEALYAKLSPAQQQRSQEIYASYANGGPDRLIAGIVGIYKMVDQNSLKAMTPDALASYLQRGIVEALLIEAGQ